MDIKNIVFDFIKREKLIEYGDRILLSLSAGKDSMMLFHILSDLKNHIDFDFAVFHLNHMTRGNESKKDEEFVIELTRRNKIEIFCESYNFQKNKSAGVSFEEDARNIRYRFLTSISGKNGFNKTATSHNRSDSVETVLMRLFTGTGIHGLKGISHKTGNIIRPILILTSDEVYAYLKTNSIKWREDSSNKDIRYLRNFTRNRIIPVIKEKFTEYDKSITRLSNISYENDQLIVSLLKEKFGVLYESGKDFVNIELLKYDALSLKFVIPMAVRNVLSYKINHHILNELLKNLKGKKSNILLYKNKDIEIKKIYKNNKALLNISTIMGKRSFKEWVYKVILNDQAGYNLAIEEIGLSVFLKVVDYNYFKKNLSGKNIFISIDEKIDTLYIRNRRAGDKIKLEFGTKKIKKLFIEKKLDNETKNCIPLIIINSKIAAYMPGIIMDFNNRISIFHRVDENSKKIVVISKI